MVSDTAKTHKNRSANLYNRFLFCNTFLLPVLYLHRYFLQQTLATLVLAYNVGPYKVLGQKDICSL